MGGSRGGTGAGVLRAEDAVAGRERAGGARYAGPLGCARAWPAGRTGGAAAVVPRFAVLAVLVAALLVGPPGVPAQQVRFGGQVRPRYELRDPARDGRRDDFVSMRVRAQVSAALERDVRVFVQLQDVRLWGEEGGTLSDFRADNFDLHQGYVELEGLGAPWLALRIGRQEAAFGEERLIGPVDWSQQGRSFNGVRATARRPWGSLDLLAFKLGDRTADARRDDEAFFGAYGVVGAGAAGALDVYALHNRARGQATTDQGTVGARWAGRAAGVSYRGEASYQFGERGGRDVAAYMLAGSAGVTGAGGRGGLTLWYDYLSGDGDPSHGEVRVFETLFATNHKFYGYADLFTDIPAHTGGRGLQDAAVKLSWKLRDDAVLNLDLHAFRVAQRGALKSGRLGEEVDLTATWRYAPGVTLLWGFSYVVQGDALAELGRLSRDLSYAYLMLTASF